MDVWSACMIDSRVVYGFLGAGKTTYIRDCIANDFFYKYGTTLVLCFERGREVYDEQVLQARNAHVAYYEGVLSRKSRETIKEFCEDSIRRYHPDRIYIEMNAALPQLREFLPDELQITSTVTWFDWNGLDQVLSEARQMTGQMVRESQQITFRGCPSREMLAPYSQEFRLMNHRASYLRQDPMGYHERAFDLFVPYSLQEKELYISVREYLPFWLDAAEHPEHYEGKRIHFTDPLELRHVTDDASWSAGRVVMTCCMADLQFMSLELAAGVSIASGAQKAEEVHSKADASIAAGEDTKKTVDRYPSKNICEAPGTSQLRTTDEVQREAPGAGNPSEVPGTSQLRTSGEVPIPQGGWITMEAIGNVSAGTYGRKVLKLEPVRITPAPAPRRDAILQAARPGGASENAAAAMVQRLKPFKHS